MRTIRQTVYLNLKFDSNSGNLKRILKILKILDLLLKISNSIINDFSVDVGVRYTNRFRAADYSSPRKSTIFLYMAVTEQHVVL